MRKWDEEKKKANASYINEPVTAAGSWGPLGEFGERIQHSYPRNKETGIIIQQLWSVIG